MVKRASQRAERIFLFSLCDLLPCRTACLEAVMKMKRTRGVRVLWEPVEGRFANGFAVNKIIESIG